MPEFIPWQLDDEEWSIQDTFDRVAEYAEAVVQALELLSTPQPGETVH